MKAVLDIIPHDPIIARDGRPFGMNQGIRMHSLNWLYPSVLAGSLRTMIGKALFQEFSEDVISKLLQIHISGPLPKIGSEIFIPAPADILTYQEPGSEESLFLPLRPLENPNSAYGCYYRNQDDVLNPIAVTKDVKPIPGPAFWSFSNICEWLNYRPGSRFALPPADEKSKGQNGFLDSIEKDERFHVWIDSDAGSAKEGMLYKTVGLDCNINQDIRNGNNDSVIGKIIVTAMVEADEKIANHICSLNELHPIGGERRLAAWSGMPYQAEVEDTENPWQAPLKILESLQNTNRIRLVLATPAIFEQGWKPTKLCNGNLLGGEIQLQLISACIGRWVPLSGWSYREGQVGPKAIRRMVPAGSVYFFKVTKGRAADLAEKLWMKSISDDVTEFNGLSPDEQVRRDGFGLALWGPWDYEK